MASSLKILQDFDDQSACTVDVSCWDLNDNGAMCSQCNKQVYDIALLTKVQTLKLIFKKRGRLCVKISKDTNGNIIYKNGLISKLLGYPQSLYLKGCVGLYSLFTANNLFAVPQPDALVENFRQVESIRYGEGRTSTAIATLLGYLEGSFGALIMVASCVTAVILLIFKQLKLALVFWAFTCLIFLIRILIGTIYFAGIGIDNSVAPENSLLYELTAPVVIFCWLNVSLVLCFLLIKQLDRLRFFTLSILALALLCGVIHFILPHI